MIYACGSRVQTLDVEMADEIGVIDRGRTGLVTGHQGPELALVCFDHQEHAWIPEGRLRSTRLPLRRRGTDARMG